MVFQIFQWDFTPRRVFVTADTPETPLLVGSVPFLQFAGLFRSLFPVISFVTALRGTG